MIKFYGPQNAFGEFSNFFQRDVLIDDHVWPTTEHFFQAAKSLDPDVHETIRRLPSPGEAKKFGRQLDLRPDWDQVVGDEGLHSIFRDDRGIVVEFLKDHIMYHALVEKFTQHEDLAKLLLSTGEQAIVEGSPRDAYWGVGPMGDGLNKLGRMLVLLRKSMRRHALDKEKQAP